MSDPLRVALVGAGLIGQRRAAIVNQDETVALVKVADLRGDRADEVASRWGIAGCGATTDWEDAIRSSELDVVIVSTVNKSLAPITIASLESGKHVLCEKPMGRNLGEARRMAQAARSSGKVLKIGFNHRFHPGIFKAHELCGTGEIGPLFFIRCVYGHGGRPGYDQEWRADPDLAGGGELLDQGIHVIDLCRWFLGDFTEAYGLTATYFWDLGRFPSAGEVPGPMAGYRLEDNGFALLRTPAGQVASLHTSWTQWKNRFSFEVFGRDGYLRVEGLGGSYGAECLTLGRRRPESGPPQETVWEFPGADGSWEAEWLEFTAAIREGRPPLGNERDGLEAMRLVDAIYRSARLGSAPVTP